MSNVILFPGSRYRANEQVPARRGAPDPRGSKSWIGVNPTRLDHDRYPRLRASRQCLQCGGAKVRGMLRCPSCNRFNVSKEFLIAAERFLGGEPVCLPSAEDRTGRVDGIAGKAGGQRLQRSP